MSAESYDINNRDLKKHMPNLRMKSRGKPSISDATTLDEVLRCEGFTKVGEVTETPRETLDLIAVLAAMTGQEVRIVGRREAYRPFLVQDYIIKSTETEYVVYARPKPKQE